MKRKMLTIWFLALALILCPAEVSKAAPMGTAFTYQGRLLDKKKSAEGLYDFEFSLYDDPNVIMGNQVGSTLDINDLDVVDGHFTAELDFGSGIFNGEARWLEIAVRKGASTGSFTTLSPCQEVTPTPYALALPGLWTQQNATSANLVGGYSGNSVTAGVVGATIGGGGDSTYPNKVTDDYSTVAGGRRNQAGDDAGTTSDAWYATVGGGWANTASGGATVGGGYDNTASGNCATLGGGGYNEASSDFATVGGGAYNTASSEDATVGGGLDNTASGWDATVAGGWENTASGGAATVGGGLNNTASGSFATVAGGIYNTASGGFSFAAGRRAKANHAGAFVWADSTDEDFASTGNHQFLIRASGGVGIGTPHPNAQLHVVGNVKIVDGNQGEGKVLTSDPDGVGSWQAPPDSGLPSGVIVMWSGLISEIPAGWALCDGSNGTPDLRDRFIVGARQDDGGIAKTDITGSLTQAGGNTSHSHTGNTASDASGDYRAWDAPPGTSGYQGDASRGWHTHVLTINSAESLSPYYALAFIMKL